MSFDTDLDSLLENALREQRSSTRFRGEASLRLAQQRQRRALAKFDAARESARRALLARALASEPLDAQRFRWLLESHALEEFGSSPEAIRRAIDEEIISEARAVRQEASRG